jgi:K+-sensing histidine kinase KdpD
LNLLARILTISRLSQVQVVINYDRYRNFLSIDINESGTGIIFSEIELIQKEFKHVKEHTQLTDSGEGLAFLFSKKIMEQYEGSIKMSANHEIGLSL